MLYFGVFADLLPGNGWPSSLSRGCGCLLLHNKFSMYAAEWSFNSVESMGRVTYLLFIYFLFLSYFFLTKP
jgi:hypothetical protein